MAVVIVMDISNTMNSAFGDYTRYTAAMAAAESFLDKFAGASNGVSKIGYVAFNTDAHQIFGLQACSTKSQANALKNLMRTETGKIINAAGYGDSKKRFTNVEAGLKMGWDMVKNAPNPNKYIIFLSDGFPTTYISNGYTGYDTYDTAGSIFKDRVLNKPCSYGTSYSDEAAIRARKMAVSIKNSGVQIFSIGVDVGGQTIQQYITQSENANGFSVVDRTSTSYEIGDASSTEAYKNWLRNSIGSGIYYDSTNLSGLQAAYDDIFAKIKQTHEESARAMWVTNDPIPVDGAGNVEFIGLYDKDGVLGDNVIGASGLDAENTASFETERKAISWDLKKSGYTETTSGNTTTYRFTLKYRVRLMNEASGFKEGTTYPTNDKTTLTYKVIESNNGVKKVSEARTIEYPIPSVKGYLAELGFSKTDDGGLTVPGAEFTLAHNTEVCRFCRGDGKTQVAISDFTATSGSDGTVSFARIPSGHTYTLEETTVPAGYLPSGIKYSVTVAYDVITVTPSEGEWSGTVVNRRQPVLPATGGAGTALYAIGGIALMAISLLYRCKLKRRRGKGANG